MADTCPSLLFNRPYGVVMQEVSNKSEILTFENQDLAGARIPKYQKSIVVLLALLGILSSVFLYISFRRNESARIGEDFETAAGERISVLEEHLDNNLQTLDWLAAFHQSSNEVGRSEFRKFTKQFLRKHDDIRSLQWLPLVRDEERAEYEALAKKDGLTHFRITEKQGKELFIRAPKRREYFPVHFIEPYEDNEERLGFDMASIPEVLETLKWSRENNRLATTSLLAVTQKKGDEYCILIFNPVYERPATKSSSEDRRDKLEGFMLAELRIASLLDHVVSLFDQFEMDIYLCESSLPGNPCVLTSHLSRMRSAVEDTLLELCAAEKRPKISGLQLSTELQVANRKWTILCVPTPAFLVGRRVLTPSLAMITGLGFTGLVTLLGIVVLQRITRSRRFTAQLLISRQKLIDEIAEREKTERALGESEKRFSLAVQGSSDGIWDWPDLNVEQQWWSPRWYELLGYKNGEIEASYSNFLSLIHPDDREETRASMLAHFEERQPVDVEYRLRMKSGEYRWFRGRARAVWDESGKARRISGSIQDIDEQKKAETRILKEKRFSENLIESSVDGILAYDHKCCCTIWNAGIEHISGIGRDQALGKCVFEVFPFLKKADERKFFYEALAGRTVVARDRPYIIPETGTQGYFEGYYSPLHDEQGSIIGGLAIIRDITARKQAEDELQKSKALYQNLVETSHDLIFQCNRKGEFVFLNKAWQNTLDYRPEEMLGQPFSNFKKPASAERDSETFTRLLEGESIEDYETTYVTKSGDERYLLFNVVPKCDVSGRVVGIQGTAFDFTERKLAEQALEELNRELEEAVERLIAANRELGDFAHITAHDLKTPLRGIGTLAGIISEEYKDKLDPHGKELLQMLVGRASRMYQQIGSILEYSEIGRIDEKKRRVDLNKLVEAITMAIDPPENIEIHIEGALPTLICNETRLAQVFQNLLDNAIKHIDKPRGLIRIECVEERNLFKFSIADNGRGIEEKYFKKIFRLFQTLDRRDEVEAAGIGLSLVKKIVEISGGTIWVESEVGQGSTFLFTLPKQKMQANG